jgi:molecular chaperone IbpA
MSFQRHNLNATLVGFDQLLTAAAAAAKGATSNYPPYNLVKIDEDNYRITVAIAGFKPEEISVIHEAGKLTVEGKRASKDEGELLYRGISARDFTRSFVLHEYMTTSGATMEDGLLHIDMKRVVPDEKKPRTVHIKTKG